MKEATGADVTAQSSSDTETTLPHPETTAKNAPPAPGFRQMALLLMVGWGLTNIA
jgi:hypothetical protein